MPHSPLATLRPAQRATRGWIAHLTWSPDGRLLACSSAGGVGVWRGTLAGRPAFLKGHDGPVKGVAFAPNSATLATASADTTVKIWDLRAFSPGMAPLATYTDFDNAVERVTFTRTGALAACGVDGTVRLLLPDGTARTLFQHDDEANSLALSADGRLLASGGRDNTARLYDLHASTPLAVLNGHQDWVRVVACHPSQPYLLTASRDQTARLWDITDPAAPSLLYSLPHPGDVRAAAFSSDGSVIATGSTGHRVHLWQTADGAPVATLDAHTKPVVALAFHPQQPILVSGGGDNQILLWAAGDDSETTA